MELIFKLLWILLPAGVANIVPVLVHKINFLNYPIDGGKIFFGQPLFGKNKTWRGFFFGVLAAMMTACLQRWYFLDFSIYLFGFLLGFGALSGDLTKSFFKRRLKIAPGAMWIPFDQIDWIIGAMVFSSWQFSFVLYPWWVCLSEILLYGCLHPVVNLLGYWLEIKPAKF